MLKYTGITSIPPHHGTVKRGEIDVRGEIDD